MNEELKRGLEQITGELQSLVNVFITKHKLKKDNRYQIESDQEVVYGYFDDCLACINPFNGIVYIWVSFYKEKRNGKKSKTKTGIRATSITNMIESQL